MVGQTGNSYIRDLRAPPTHCYPLAEAEKTLVFPENLFAMLLGSKKACGAISAALFTDVSADSGAVSITVSVTSILLLKQCLLYLKRNRPLIIH